METLLIVTVVVLGITAILLQFKNATKFVHFFNLLMLTIVGMILVPSFGETSTTPLFALLGIAALNFVVSQLGMLRKPYVRVIVPLISIVVFLASFKGGTIQFMGDDYVSVNKFLVGGSIIAVLAYEIAFVKIKILKKLLGGVEEQDSITAILLLLLAVGLFMGTLASSSFGLLAVATAFLSASFYRSDDSNKLFTSLLMLTVLPLILDLAGEDSSVLVDGDVLQGLFVGAFGMYFIQKLWSSPKRNSIALGLGYVIFLSVAFAILWSGTMFYKMGGMDALAGVFVGVALINAAFGKGFTAQSLFMLLFAGSLIIPKYMVNEEQAAFEEQVMITAEGGVDEEGNVVPPPTVLSLSELAGSYTLINDSSTVSFYLGEGGKTKGAFKKVKGSFNINEDMSKSSLSITLAMSDFTTFMGQRDVSLRGDDYFKADKFPALKYKAVGFEETGENTYKVVGDFTMLGVTKEIEVSLQRIEMGDKKLLIGSGKIDRTIFGMTPDASEGNVVGFNYQVELK